VMVSGSFSLRLWAAAAGTAPAKKQPTMPSASETRPLERSPPVKLTARGQERQGVARPTVAVAVNGKERHVSANSDER
jgi:hypothetical protein